MTPTEFISFAESMLQEPVEPARSRSIVSRAYYGAFHIALSFLAEQGLSTEANHGHLQHDYLNSGDGQASAIGMLLQEMHAARVDADYRLLKKKCEARSLGVYCVSGAQMVAGTIDQLRVEFLQNQNAKQAFADTIRAYRQKVRRRV